MEEVRRLGSLPGSEINEAKKVLAFEVTNLVHGKEEAIKAQNAAENGVNIVDMLVLTELASSKGEGRRLINQGGLLLNDEKVESIEYIVNMDDIKEEGAMLKKGKKTYHRIILK